MSKFIASCPLAGTIQPAGALGWAAFILRLLLFGFFLLMAVRNLSGDQKMASEFARWGYPTWFRWLTAALQAAGAVLLLSPQLTFYGAGLLSCILVGAIATHLRHDAAVTAVTPLVFIVFTLALAYMYRPTAVQQKEAVRLEPVHKGTS